MKDILVYHRLDNRVATLALAKLLSRSENIRWLKPEDTLMSMLERNGNTITIKFSALAEDTTSKILQVDSLNFWSKLDSTPTLNEYTGSQFLIYNRTSNCARAITQPFRQTVAE